MCTCSLATFVSGEVLRRIRDIVTGAEAPSIPNIIIFTMDYRLVSVNPDGPLQALRIIHHHSVNDPCECCQSGKFGQRKQFVVKCFGIFNPFRWATAVRVARQAFDCGV